MKQFSAAVAVAVSATIILAACSGGGSSPAVPVASVSAGSATPVTGASSTVQTAKTAFTITLPFSSTPASTARSPQFVATQTKTMYFSLENSPGHGNATYSYTFSVDSTHCVVSSDGSSQTCSYSATVPVGQDAFSILTVDANGIPLGYDPYVNGTVNADGTGLVVQTFSLSPIVAKAVSTYKFQPYASNPPSPASLAGITTMIYDADGNALSTFITADDPIGNAYSSWSVAQDNGQFIPTIIAHGTVVQQDPAATSFTFQVSAATQVLDEIGNGTTNPFTINVTTTTPAVSFTASEFPQLAATATVPASSTSLALTCQFSSPAPTTDPCLGSTSIPIPIH